MKLPALLAVLAVLIMPAKAIAEQAVLENILVGCNLCHIERMAPVGDRDSVNFKALKSGRAGYEDICYSCHNGIVRDSRRRLWEGFQHPSGVKPQNPSLVRKGGFPLDDSSRLYCGSCHTPHIKGEGIGLFMRFTFQSGDFCQRCHPRHAAGPDYGEHFTGRVKETALKSIVKGSSLGVGSVINCKTCHRIHGAASTFLLSLNPWGKKGLCQKCHPANPSSDGIGLGNSSHPVNIKLKSGKSLGWSRKMIVSSPTGNVDCWSCHRAHDTPKGSPLLVSELYRENGCGRCHEDKVSFSSLKRNHPVETSTGAEKKDAGARTTCLICHRAHNSNKRENTLLNFRTGDSNLCRDCHGDHFVEDTNHALGTIGKGSMIVSLETLGAVFGPGDELTCFSCHIMHGAKEKTPALVTEEKLLCLYCHQKENYLDTVYASPGTHPVNVPLADGAPDKILKAGGRIGDQNELICTTCHRSHHSKSESKGLIMDREAISCTLCHNNYGDESDIQHGQDHVEDKETPGAETCRLCHSEHGWVIRVPEGEEDFLTRLCLACHNKGGKAADKLPEDISHPIGIKTDSRKALSTDLPFYLNDGRRFRKGVISCATCHEVHPVKAADQDFLLRLGLREDVYLCAECHQDKMTIVGTKHDISLMAPDKKNQAGIPASRGGVCSACHTAHNGLKKTMWARMTDNLGNPGAQLCKSCHSAGLLAEEKVIGPFAHVSEAEPAPPGGNSAGAIGPSGSSVTCTSCHDPHRWDPQKENNLGVPGVDGTAANSFLRWPDDGRSSLCLNCHNTKRMIAGTGHDFRGRSGNEKRSCFSGSEGQSLCGNCHLVHDGDRILGWTGEISEEEEVVSFICGKCHGEGGCAENKQTGIYSHPVGISPVGHKGRELPLFDNRGRQKKFGLVSCSTCHDVHFAGSSSREENTAMTAGGEISFPMLRLRPDGHSPLCAECHTEQSLIAGTDHDLRVTAPESQNAKGDGPSDSGTCGVCHSIHQGSFEFYLWNRPLGPGPDISTRLCTGCHQGGDIGKMPARPYVHFKSSWNKDIASPRTAFTLKKGRQAQKDPPLQLYTGAGYTGKYGLIACPTCHDPHRWDTSEQIPGRGVPQEGNKSNSFLRVKGSFAIMNSFCTRCHPGDVVDKYQNFHSPEQ